MELSEVQKAARPIAMVVLAVFLCAMAALEQTGYGEAPKWFIGPGAAIFFEWVGEWVVYWKKRGAI